MAIPDVLNGICAKAMATDPAARFPTARALADELDDWLLTQHRTARRVTPAFLYGLAAVASVLALLVGIESALLLARAPTDLSAALVERPRTTDPDAAAFLDRRPTRQISASRHPCARSIAWSATRRHTSTISLLADPLRKWQS